MSMKAVVFHGPFDIRTESKPIPQIQSPGDVIVKVKYSGLCGTDLHSYRGHIKGPVDTIIGHEFLGTVHEIGSDITKFKVGDDVLSTFTIQCGQCWYCKHGYSGQCDVTNTFGKVGLDGGQAEYVRVPYAETTLISKPTSKDKVDDSIYVLMADIFITGYYGVKKIRDFLNQKSCEGVDVLQAKDATILQIGAGPVGLCGLRILKHFGFNKVVVVDGVDSRLQQALTLGAYKTVNYLTNPDDLAKIIANDTNNIGFDAVLECVGAKSAQRTAFESVRRNGFISCLGMGHDDLPFNGLDCYLKNINISFGRCHVWSLFPEALEIFEQLKQDFTGFIDHIVSIDDSKVAFELFDKQKVNKVVFDLSI
ncbi:putative zinc-type alcohol dehydrogenase-like protein AdhB [Spathaspora sp. JA1]|nr:putative zinc-type alcohol dehydrogenase-like protein AdhB [Spathaspora sp. JA1]